MIKLNFFKALTPIWLVELVLSALYSVFSSEQVTFIGIALSIFSAVLLPFFAGIRVIQAHGKVSTAVLGAISISGVTLIVVALNYLVRSDGWEPFGGFVIATLLFAVIPQAIFGAIGVFFGRKRHVSI